MKWIKKYAKYVESLKIDYAISNIDINESLAVWENAILNSIGAVELNLFDELKLSKSDYNKDSLNLDSLAKKSNFINSLSSIGLKKSEIFNLDDFETFINKTCRFIFIYTADSTELENPKYILFQNWNDVSESWNEPKLYKVNDDINKFYNKLSSKTIEILFNGKRYIYNTSNGNEWSLQNPGQADDTFKKYFRKEDLEKTLKDNKVKINII